jgi:hypothetical protein
MARIFPGATVPNRKPAPNPHTCSGHPRWNTYARLDCTPTSWDGSDFVVTKGRPGRKRRGKKKKNLHKDNLFHRYRKTDNGHAVKDRLLEDLRGLVVQVSRNPADGTARERIKLKMQQLTDMSAYAHIAEVWRLATARGVQELV